jgi:hypothetical protein
VLDPPLLATTAASRGMICSPTSCGRIRVIDHRGGVSREEIGRQDANVEIIRRRHPKKSGLQHIIGIVRPTLTATHRITCSQRRWVYAYVPYGSHTDADGNAVGTRKATPTAMLQAYPFPLLRFFFPVFELCAFKKICGDSSRYIGSPNHLPSHLPTYVEATCNKF